MSGATGTVDILQRLMQDTDSRLATLEVKTTERHDMEQEFAQLQEKIEKEVKTGKQRRKDIREKTLNASREELNADTKKEEEDFAEAMFGVQALTSQIDKSYDTYQAYDPADTARIEAEKGIIANLDTQTNDVQKGWYMFESHRQHDIAAIDAQKLKVQDALVEAQSIAQSNARARLRKAKMDDAMQELDLRSQKAISIMTERRKTVNEYLRIAIQKKAETFKLKEQTARMLQDLDTQLTKLESNLRQAQDVLGTYVNGTPEHVAQSEVVSNLQTEVEETRGSRNITLVDFEKHEEAVEYFQAHENAHRTLRDSLAMWIVMLTRSNDTRRVLFKSRLEAMKAFGDEEVAHTYNKVGQESDLRGLEYMVRVRAVSTEAVLRTIEEHPEVMETIHGALAASAESEQGFRVRFSEAIEKFKQQYGYDPTEAFYFHYEKESDGTKG